ncbi:adenine phosphoribosyltransferase [Effusibacillus dendaii]|uniref:Adenine phosphoribosyltransferase n=1 Tax=Effusibacillus dendaii TaxID=2743772 RepID=A0A7I8DDN8_9BACL|nr:adenine phosphoribosyltransferase [Effusibacillus dendaii]BCJ88137.1 adenine phosphoribosyltransferase [Effusibacillus dendaii]
MNLKDKIRVISDFPEPGIRFKDITTLLQDGAAFRSAIDQMAAFARQQNADLIAGPEARGFVLAAPVAYSMGVGFIPIRKSGKLPGETVSVSYQLEYGKDKLEIHRDAIQPGQRVVIADDLLATGGTVSSTIKLVEELGGIVAGLAFMIELTYLSGREKLKNYEVFSLVQY